jgi:hypothetical protein
MIYKTQINKKVQNIRVYTVLMKSGKGQNFMTRLFLKIINRGKKEDSV